MLLEFDDRYLTGLACWILLLGLSLWLLLKLRRKLHTSRGLTAANAGLSLWLLLVLLTGCELYFAFMFDETDSFNMTQVSRKWFRRYVEPHQFALTFSSGESTLYRDDREFQPPGPSQTHVMFIGDSFTFGHGIKRVEDRFSNRLRDTLDSRAPGRFVVSNLADAGRDLHWVEAVLERVFDSGIRTELVVYVMCLNDIETFHPRHRTYYQDLGSHGPDFFLFQDSYFLNLLYFRVRQFSVPAVRDYYAFVEEYYRSEPWQRMRGKLAEVHQLCRNHDCQLAIVVFPFLHRLQAESGFTDAHRVIGEFCRDEAIPCVDLLPMLQQHAEENLTVSRFDAHPNVRANQLAAEEIERQLLPRILQLSPSQQVEKPHH